jgi:hypothetical protein
VAEMGTSSNDHPIQRVLTSPTTMDSAALVVVESARRRPIRPLAFLATRDWLMLALAADHANADRRRGECPIPPGFQ